MRFGLHAEAKVCLGKLSQCAAQALYLNVLISIGYLSSGLIIVCTLLMYLYSSISMQCLQRMCPQVHCTV